MLKPFGNVYLYEKICLHLMTLSIKTDLSKYLFFNKLLALVSLLCMRENIFLKTLL